MLSVQRHRDSACLTNSVRHRPPCSQDRSPESRFDIIGRPLTGLTLSNAATMAFASCESNTCPPSDTDKFLPATAIPQPSARQSFAFVDMGALGGLTFVCVTWKPGLGGIFYWGTYSFRRHQLAYNDLLHSSHVESRLQLCLQAAFSVT